MQKFNKAAFCSHFGSSQTGCFSAMEQTLTAREVQMLAQYRRNEAARLAAIESRASANHHRQPTLQAMFSQQRNETGPQTSQTAQFPVPATGQTSQSPIMQPPVAGGVITAQTLHSAARRGRGRGSGPSTGAGRGGLARLAGARGQRTDLHPQ